MLCQHPYQKGVLELGCGRCKPCRINRSRLWVSRMLLESYEHEFNCFTTLTYGDMIGPLWLNKRHLQLFLKRLRMNLPEQVIRYYAVGEYGDKSWRPHYHLVLFGVSTLQASIIEKSWPFGFTFTGTAEAKSISYVAQYVTKKMNNPKDRRLNGRPPEFCLMSNKPGLGAKVVPRIKEGLDRYPMIDPLSITSTRHGATVYPLGRHLRDKLTDAMGVTKEQKADNLRTLIATKFHEIVEQGTTNYQDLRRAKIRAALGRRIERIKSL